MAAGAFAMGPPADDAELAAYERIVTQVYNSTEETTRRAWLARVGRDNIRGVRDGTAVVGGEIVVPMGQWFGGRSVPMTGIAAVAVTPEARSRGSATALMRETVAELARDGRVPLSALYPATQPVYRAAGYERAGCEYRTAVPARAMDVNDRSLPIRPATAQDAPAIEELYRRRARASNGNLDRSPYIWKRIREPLQGACYGYVVEGGSGIEAYVHYMTRESPDEPEFKLWCPDLLASTRAAARRLLTFFADHRSMTGEVAWRGSPGDPLLAAMREQYAAQVKLWNVWMLRIVDVAGALTARGYAPGVAGEVHLDVLADEVVPANVGRFTLHVEDGRAEVARGGRGTVRTDIRGLAALYTGFQSPADLRASGFVEADDAELATAAAVFTGPHPWMADHF